MSAIGRYVLCGYVLLRPFHLLTFVVLGFHFNYSLV